MYEFKKNDKVKIVNHPTKPHYCGLEGEIIEVREGLGPSTHGIAISSEIPQPVKQWKYVVQIDCPSGELVVYDLEGEWLELL